MNRAWRLFDRAVVTTNKKLGGALDHFVRPRPKLRNGRSLFDLAFEELTHLPRKKRRR
jgi:hypothetical protein